MWKYNLEIYGWHDFVSSCYILMLLSWCILVQRKLYYYILVYRLTSWCNENPCMKQHRVFFVGGSRFPHCSRGFLSLTTVNIALRSSLSTNRPHGAANQYWNSVFCFLDGRNFLNILCRAIVFHTSLLNSFADVDCPSADWNMWLTLADINYRMNDHPFGVCTDRHMNVGQ